MSKEDQIAELQSTITVLDYDIDVMRQSESMPFFDEEKLEEMCGKSLKLNQELKQLKES